MRIRLLLCFCLLISEIHAESVAPTPAFEWPPGSTISIRPGFPSNISVNGLYAQGGGETTVGPCTVAPQSGATFTVFGGNPLLSEAQTQATITLFCSTSGFVNSTLTCNESANPGNNGMTSSKTWPVICANAFFDFNSAFRYAPNVSTTIRLGSASNFIGVQAAAPLLIDIRNGFMTPNPMTLSNCQISGSGSAAFTPIANTIPLGALGLSCTRTATNASATLSCTETMGANTRSVSWPLLCPAGIEGMFADGFE
jgi:hypothetical protein